MSVTVFLGEQNKPIIQHRAFTFPGGERHVELIDADVNIHTRSVVVIRLDYRNSNDIIDMLLLVDAIRAYHPRELHLDLPYVPYARQDRAANRGEAHSLRVFVNLLKSCNFNTITVIDPHSDVLEGMFPPGALHIVRQHTLAQQIIKNEYGPTKIALVAPDAGALKKIHALAGAYTERRPVITAEKIRDTQTGNITGVSVRAVELADTIDTLVIVDDICDGGRTFTGLAAELWKIYPKKKIVLYVTHGIFSAGLAVFRDNIDQILVYNLMNDDIKSAPEVVHCVSDNVVMTSYCAITP